MYNIKIYNLDGTYKFTLNTKAIKNDIAFSASINSGQGQLSLKLDKTFIDTSLMNTDIIKVYNKTTLIYTGIIQAIIRVINSDFEEISLPILGIGTITSYILYRNTGSAIFTKTQDPSQTIKDIIDYLNTIYTAGFFSYDSNSIEMYGTSISIDFDNVSCFKALQQCIKITNFKLFINNDGKIYFKSKPLTSDHRLTVGKDITNISVNEYSEKLVNKLIVKYKTNSKTYEDVASQNTYGVKEIVISKTDLDLAGADEFGNNYIATYKQPINKTTIILNKNFDFNLIKIGDTVRVNNFKYSIRNLQVVKYTYSKNQMTLLLEDFDNFGTALGGIVGNTDFAPTSTGGGGTGTTWGTITGTLSNQTDLQTTLNAKENVLGFTPEDIIKKGAINGYAPLDGTGKIPSANLPSFVDDVLEFANLASFPTTGEVGKIYVALDTNLTYRWGGTTYVELGGGSFNWGSITGTLSNQTDLQNILDTKRNFTERFTSIITATTITPNGDNSDEYIVTALSTNATINAPTGTPTQAQRLVLRFTDDGTTRTLTWNAIYDAGTLTLPTSTPVGTPLYIGFIYNIESLKWDYVGVNAGSTGGGGGVWGSITGTLSAQTDLQSALDGKANNSTAWINLALTNGWILYPAPYGIARYRKHGNLIEIQCMIRNGGAGLIATLPATYKPPSRLIFPATSNQAFGSIDIDNVTGQILTRVYSSAWLAFIITYSV